VFVIVTPAHDERDNIAALAGPLAASTVHPDVWVVVDDGSSDGTGDVAAGADLPFPVRVVRRTNDGGLIGGSAFRAWQFGIDALTESEREAMTEVMKLDADVALPAPYLERALAAVRAPGVGLVGGYKSDRSDREQLVHVPGSVGLYSSAGFDALQELPRHVGFDVVDEVAVRRAGLEVVVLRDLPYAMRRPVGASQGRVHGRRRNGVVCRWVGYSRPYFLLHVVRYVFRPPYAVGALAMAWGYLRAGRGPYPDWAREGTRDHQRSKLRALLRNPVGWLRRTYTPAAAP
jgi:glycosyltransferase involved in cell wall biosynthesis